MPPFPTLHSNRLTLRPLTPADAPAIFTLFSSDQVTRYYDLATMTQESEATNWIEAMTLRHENNEGIRWAISPKQETELIGTCGLVWRPLNRSAILGYDLLPEHWGKGYATEAARMALTAAYRDVAPFELNRVEAYTYPDNPASAAVLTKLGFTREGLLRQWGYWKDGYHDMECFSVLREEKGFHRPPPPSTL